MGENKQVDWSYVVIARTLLVTRRWERQKAALKVLSVLVLVLWFFLAYRLVQAAYPLGSVNFFPWFLAYGGLNTVGIVAVVEAHDRIRNLLGKRMTADISRVIEEVREGLDGKFSYSSSLRPAEPREEPQDATGGPATPRDRLGSTLRYDVPYRPSHDLLGELEDFRDE